MRDLAIGVSGLFASQRALDVIGQNLANVNTPGYHRQVTDLRPLTTGDVVGAGVTVVDIVRQVNALIETAFTRSQSATATFDARLPLQQQVEGLIGNGAGSLDELLGTFYNGVETLTTRPDDPSQRLNVLTSLSNVTARFNQTAGDLGELRAGAVSQVKGVVEQINSFTSQIADLNSQIQSIKAVSGNANELQDQRDQLVNQLAKLVDVRTIPQPFGVVNVLGPGAALVVGNIPTSFQTGTDTNNDEIVTAVGTSRPLTPTGGQLAGLLTFVNQTLPSFQQRLDTLAAAFAQAVDTIQATGLTSNGPQTVAAGTRPVTNATVPLATAGTLFPVQAGTLSISITDQTTGQRTLVQVAVDPATQSLQQLATDLTTATGGRLQASVNGANNTLQLQAQAGFAFDFAGQSPSTPTFTGFAGTTTPQLNGIFTGPNTAYTFQVVGSGTVGQTPGLALQVTDASGATVATLNIGQGYTPGDPLTLPGGVSLQLSAGTLTAGSFTFPVVSQPDTSGVLAALGVNALLTGSTAFSLGVNPTILANPTLLAGSRTGQPSDSSNLQRLAATRDQRALSNGTQTFQVFYDSMVSDVGSLVHSTKELQQAQQALGQKLDAQRQAVSGVDSNEELVNMLQFQRAFQMASKYLATANSILDDLLNIIP